VLRCLATLGAVALFLVSCSKSDSYVYPSVRSEFVDGYVDANQRVDRILTDGMQTYTLQNTVKATDYQTDSIYRFYCMYAISEENDQQVVVYRLRPITSSLPIPASYYKKGVIRDPLKVQSIWRGSSYLNIIARPMVQNRPHAYGFIEDSLVTVGKCRKLHLSLYHDRNEDVEAYEENTYFSIPLKQYNLEATDSIIFTAVTYDGSKTWKFVYDSNN
jgi:hypothetical protein